MSSMQPASIVLVASGSRPRRWLVVRRPEPPHEWSIPGGHVERGETPAAAGIREIREETGVEVRSVTPLGVGQDRGRPVYVFIATAWSGRARPAEGWPVSWATWPQLRAQAVRYGAFLDAIAARLQIRP